MTRATDMFAAERERHVNEEGYTAEHDQDHVWSLTRAGAAYADNTAQQIAGLPTVVAGAADMSEDGGWWPWHSSYWKPTGDPKRDLVKAGSLLAAALDAILDAEGADS